MRHAEKALRLNDLSATVAGAAGGPSAAIGRSAAVARVAGVEFVELDFLFATVDGLLEAQLHVVAQVRSTCRAGGAALAAPAEQVLDVPLDLRRQLLEAHVPLVNPAGEQVRHQNG